MGNNGKMITKFSKEFLTGILFRQFTNPIIKISVIKKPKVQNALFVKNCVIPSEVSEPNLSQYPDKNIGYLDP